MDSTQQLEQAFADVHRGQDPHGTSLEDAVRHYTDEMKMSGWTAEQVIVGLKRAANRSGTLSRKTPRSITEPSTAAQQLLSQAVKILIERYYDGENK